MTNRIVILDELRGIAIILMIIYHTLYSLEFIFNYDLGFQLLSNPLTIALQLLIGCLFVFISGISSGLSSSVFYNGIKTGLVALVITLVTGLIIPTEKIVFGVLHFLSLMMILTGLYKIIFKQKNDIKSKSLKNDKDILSIFLLLISAILFVACYNISSVIKVPQGNLFTSIMGFPSKDFFSSDYYPVIPWGFLFLSGLFASKVVKKSQGLKKIKIMKNSGALATLGRNSLIIYVVHQPIIIGMIFLMNKIFNL